MDEIVEKPPALMPAGAAAPGSSAAGTNRDLSEEIGHAVARQPRDRVKCVRLFDDFYRCNWWVPGDDAGPNRAAWADTASSRIRQSRFLRATIHEGKLRVTEVAVPARDDS